MFEDDSEPDYGDELIFVQDGNPVAWELAKTDISACEFTLRLFDNGTDALPFEDSSDVEILEVADDYVDVRFTGLEE